MGQVIDFPTNYEEKLNQADQLIEKGYIDQAICLIEDFIDYSKPKQGKQFLQKKLLTCYFLKKEFDSAKDLLHDIEIDFSDLSIVAHLCLLPKFEQNQSSGTAIMLKAKEVLSPFAFKNLNELVAQLKTYYEEYWYHSIEQEINRLEQGASIEQALLIISDLHEHSTDELSFFKQKILNFFESTTSPILRMLIFELLVHKNLHWTLSFTNDLDGTTSTIDTNEETLVLFEKQLHEAIRQLDQLELEDGIRTCLEQQVHLFYQFCFPNHHQLEIQLVIEGLLTLIMGREMEFLEKNDLKSTEQAIINYTTCKLSQYILSLSSLM